MDTREGRQKANRRRHGGFAVLYLSVPSLSLWLTPALYARLKKAIESVSDPVRSNHFKLTRVKTMNSRRRTLAPVLLLALACSAQFAVRAQFEQDFKQALHWRSIGPFRGGRTRAVCGVPSRPNVFYVAQVNGGVFKTTDYGRTWTPIFSAHRPPTARRV